jgi:hypothetical protein
MGMGEHVGKRLSAAAARSRRTVRPRRALNARSCSKSSAAVSTRGAADSGGGRGWASPAAKAGPAIVTSHLRTLLQASQEQTVCKVLEVRCTANLPLSPNTN